MRSLAAIGLTLTMLVPQARCETRQLDASLFSRIDAYITGQMESAPIPGVAIAIVHEGRIVHARGFGSADLSGRAVTQQSPFVIGSVSKTMTALAVMKLVDQGKIELDAPVQRYLPPFRVAAEGAADAITVRHLLAHRSGLSLFEGRRFFGSDDTSKEALANGVRSFAGTDLLAAPGQLFEYSNANYVILGAIIEAVSGKTFEDFIEQDLFAPLGMSNSYGSVTRARQHDLATGYRYWFGQPVAFEGAIPHSKGLAPAGYLVSSVEDLGKYLISILQGLNPDGTETFLSDSIMRELVRPQFREDGEDGYAIGWSVRQAHGVKFVSHAGAVESFHAFAAMVPDEGWGFAMLVNADSYVSGPRPSTVMRGVAANTVRRRTSAGSPKRNASASRSVHVPLNRSVSRRRAHFLSAA